MVEPMARNNKPWGKSENQGSGWGVDLPANLRALADIPSENNPARMGEVQVLVSVHNADLEDFASRVHSELNSKLVVIGGEMTVTREELLKYFATAIYSRVMWVNHTMDGNSFRPNEAWALPVPMHLVVSALGRVETDQGTVYVPMWEAAGNDYLLSREEWEDVTRRLAALEPYGLRMVKALEKDEKGVEKVMSLLRLDTDEGEFFFANVPPHALECLVALIAGLTPAETVTMPTHPALVPGFRLNRTWVVRWRHDFAKLSTHRDIA